MQNTFEKTNANSLIVGSDTLDNLLSHMDSTNPQDREVTINAIETFVERYIVPAMADCPLTYALLGVFDLDEVAGAEVSGLVLGLFDQKMHELEKPSDAILKEALEYIGVELPSKEQRDRFFRCWAAERANSSVLTLIQFLVKPLVGINPIKLKSAQSEQIRIANILKNKLPGGLEYALESFHERLKRGM